MKRRAITAALIALLMTVSMLAACTNSQEALPSTTNTVKEDNKPADQPATTNNEQKETDKPANNAKETPRNETLYISGLQWGAPTNFNLISGNPPSRSTMGIPASWSMKRSS
ncbi:guanyl-specific ribonuclease Sa [Paenibacillus phyllosphaerae]|uniref:Guanyl-specific ribonuclease Sa n=1 Tax=Paenibacillus phyllosphaerae TaxID=274593 RepID=A0A7W5B5B7_9BACL|nr:hypothetical protein [Paenibacillus phyllosphaerae]MBB3114690.1 guanyl-specific ribonuclease Sa [Paenibacillus phyllosphaerae]